VTTRNPAPNTLAHFAINANDTTRARKFYERVFGWQFAPWGPPGFFQITRKEGGQPGPIGALQQRRELVPGTPMVGFECTVAVADVDRIAQAVVAAGGEILMPKVVIPTVGALVFFRDPEGNAVGAMQYDAGASVEPA
jgi:predicted enzyme related to lactoylglutathione lyase